MYLKSVSEGCFVLSGPDDSRRAVCKPNAAASRSSDNLNLNVTSFWLYFLGYGLSMNIRNFDPTC